MKRFTRILCFALVALMLCATLASCGGPAKTAEEAVAALKENGYNAVQTGNVVTAEKDGEFIAITYCSDENDAKKVYDEAKDEIEDAQEELSEAKEELEKAKAKLEEVKDDPIQKGVAEIAVAAAEKAVELASKYVDAEIGQSGNVVWIGTAEAIKAAK